jgi:recombination protein RecR
MTNYPSILLSDAVEQMASLPGVGRKTALRLVLHLLRQSNKDVDAFAGALLRLKQEVKYCKLCHTISDQEICPICQSPSRDRQTICVVENIQDVMLIENTGQYHGLYHVLGGVISPMDGVGPADLEIDSLVARIQPEGIKEVILALPTTMEGDTTNFYIYKRLQNLSNSQLPVSDIRSPKISQIARGVAIGNEIEYTDEITLGRSIVNRIEFKL